MLHLAALIAIPYSYVAPDLYVQTNVQGTLNLLNAARAADVSASSTPRRARCTARRAIVPMDEGHPLQGQSPYSASKIGADQMVNSFYTSFELPTMTIRPFNTFGPRQSARAVIPTIISQIAAGKKSIQLGALEPTRDFTYVTDTVDGLHGRARAEKGVGESINLGAGFEVSIGDTFAAIAEVMRKRRRSRTRTACAPELRGRATVLRQLEGDRTARMVARACGVSTGSATGLRTHRRVVPGSGQPGPLPHRRLHGLIGQDPNVAFVAAVAGGR